jgi:signal transduction histidine kinase/ActR/RegA family two-component response regulator
MTTYSFTTSIPLKKMQQTMRAIKSSKKKIKVVWHSKNEIGQAIDPFNELQEQQFRYQKEISEARAHLEKRVSQRTEELQLEITERKHAEKKKEKLEAQLRQAYKMEAIGTMAGGIAHDFNNILAIILGNADMAKDDIPESNPARYYIDQVLEASSRAKDLVKQILTFSRQSEQKLLPIKPCSVINESLKLFRSTTPTTVNIVQNICKDCCMIMADTTQLRQLLMNLFSNAVHAMDEKGTLEVTAAMVDLGVDDIAHQPGLNPGQHLKIKVRDTGTGMDKETQDRIFDPFYTTKEVDEGTGMGLSIVLGIVKSHKGFVQVDSEPGEGSIFTIYFPAVEDGQSQKIEEVTEVYPRGNERILFVDDEEMLAELGGRMLERLGYEVTVKSSSKDASETFKLNPETFDLVITDQSMPNMSGIELSAELLNVRPDIPIILCTGFSKKTSGEKAKEIGIKEFCVKPLDRKELAHVVRKVLDENTFHANS